MPDRSLAARVCACAKGVHLYEPMQCIVVEERAWCVWPTTVPLALAWHDEGSCHFSHALSPLSLKRKYGRARDQVWHGVGVLWPACRCSASKACCLAGQCECGRPVHPYTHASMPRRPSTHTMCFLLLLIRWRSTQARIAYM